MLIRCWGARGSIPVSGKEFIKYGGDSTCLELRTSDKDIIIIDAGSGIRRLGNRLVENNEYSYYMLFTHAHWDHILGFPFFKPLYKDETSIRMYGCSFAQQALEKVISKTMEPPHFPVNFNELKADISFKGLCEKQFHINSTLVIPVNLSHPNFGSGYKFIENGKSFVFLTDNELTYQHFGGLNFKGYVDFCKGVDLLIHDSEYNEEDYIKKKTWGHSVYKDSLNLAIEAGVKRFGLFHHNQERTDNAVDEIVEDCKNILKSREIDIECFAVAQDMEIEL